MCCDNVSRSGRHAASAPDRHAVGARLHVCKRCVVPVFLILSAETGARADSPAIPVSHLSPAECAVVVREVAVELFAQDQEIVGAGWSPQDRAKALIHRDTDGMAVRFRRMLAPIAAEVARVQACKSLEDAKVIYGATKADPPCQ